MAAPPGRDGTSGAAPQIIEWILDTRPLWPEAGSTAALDVVAHRAIGLLSAGERASARRFVFARDAKHAIGSALLKRLAICRLLPRVRWADATPVAGLNGRPTFPGVEFNVSHQAGLVALVATATATTEAEEAAAATAAATAQAETRGEEAAAGRGRGIGVGVDVVCTSERRDRDMGMIAERRGGSGWAYFVDVHSQMLAGSEIDRLKRLTCSEEDRLREFYALWCVKEAYIKMTSEGLLAGWLGELEFTAARAPVAGIARAPSASRRSQAILLGAGEEEEEEKKKKDGWAGRRQEAEGEQQGEDEDEPAWGDEVTAADLGIRFRGRPVSGVDVSLRPVEDAYMVCSVVRRWGNSGDGDRGGATGQLRIGRFRWLDLEEVLAFAERGGGQQTEKIGE